MNAPKGRATVTLEDAMQIMYLRYGRQMLDSQVWLSDTAALHRLLQRRPCQYLPGTRA